MRRSAIRQPPDWRSIFGAVCPSGSREAASTISLSARTILRTDSLIPEKLYGREREVDALITAFDRVVAGGSRSWCSCRVTPASANPSVVNELHKALVPPRGLFASGKFDQYKRDIPYATLAQAFQTLVRQMLIKSEAELRNWRTRFARRWGRMAN